MEYRVKTVWGPLVVYNTHQVMAFKASLLPSAHFSSFFVISDAAINPDNTALNFPDNMNLGRAPRARE